jgi:hypothetical protein
VTALVEFEYDARNRLISECRTDGTTCASASGAALIYDLAYEYDQGGNRTAMIDAKNDIRVDYFYDVGTVGDYGTPDSKNNRLRYYETYDTSGSDVLLSTTWYYYNNNGNVTRVVTNPEGTNDFTVQRMGYAENGNAVVYAIGETWDDSDPDGDDGVTNYTITYAKDFRYDGGRQRYRVREYDVDDLNLATPEWTVLSQVFTDYDGDQPLGDFTIVPDEYEPFQPQTSTITEERSYALGVCRVDPWDDDSDTNTEYYH